jgi:DNA-binding CsgD family transcriptional regulator
MAAHRAAKEAEVIDAIYGAIRAPQTWPDVVQRIGAVIDADIGIMLTPTLPGISAVPLVAYGLDMSPILDKFPTHAGRAVFTHRALATGRVPGAFLVDELMPPHEQAANAYWQDVIAPLGIVTGVFCMVRTPDDNMRPVLLNYFRRTGKPAFGQSDLKWIQGLLPHLRRALGVILDAPAPPKAPEHMSDLYDSIGAACFLISKDGCVLHCNPAAELLLSSHNGVEIRGGRIVLWDKEAQAELDALLRRVIGEAWSTRYRAGGELLARRASGGVPLVLVATPLGAENPIAAVAAPVRCVVFVLEEKLRADSMLAERLQRLYGFTASEAHVAIGVASSASLEELAVERGTKIGTIRTQVKSALAKTGARKQAELATLVNRLRI